MKLKKLAYKKEPFYHGHRYICVLYTGSKSRHLFVERLADIKFIKERMKAGQILEIFRDTQNYIGGYEAV